MWTQTAEGQKLVQEFSKSIVTEIAPEELDLFDQLLNEYLKDPNPPSPRKAKDDPLGFGPNEIIVAITTATLGIVKTVLNHLTTETIKVAKNESAEIVKGKIKALFSAPEKGPSTDSLSRNQMKLVMRLAERQAIEFGISPEKAKLIATALIGKLALK